MLVEFSVGNYRSFNKPVRLSLQAATKLKHQGLDEQNIFEAPDGLPLLKSAAIYGANASGKSNLIQAMGFMRKMVLGSSKESQAEEPIAVERFRLSTEAETQPACFQIIFYLNERRYRYGFELDQQRVHAEWLYHTPSQREARLFTREGNQYDISGGFKEGKGLEKRTRDNALFLSVVSQWNGDIAMQILKWFKHFNIISGLEDARYMRFTMREFKEDETFRQRAIAFVQRADVDISDIQVEEIPFGDAKIPEEVRSFLEQLTSKRGQNQELPPFWNVKTTHKKFDADANRTGWEQFDMAEQESEGTQKIFALSGPLLDTLESGKPLVIDELEARLHPLLTRAIIALFNSRQTNPKNAQLIFATHDTNLLSNRLLRRDQIWFTEKDRYGATDLYSLAEFQQPVRNDASYDKDYFAGKYGAIPFLSGLSDLFQDWGNDQEA